MMNISAVVITKNEERNLGRCLHSLQGVVEEVVVVDSFSTDGTEAIARAHGARFHPTEWMGYADTKNLANSLATHGWILSLDADEELSPELRTAILTAKQAPDAGAYIIRRLPNYCGKWIYHSGWNPDRKVRLFNRNTARWEGRYIHERIVLAPGTTTRELPGWCFHYTMHSVREHMDTVNRFSELQVQEMMATGKRAGFFHLFLKPLAEFFISYFLKKGILDGKEGFIISCINSYSKFIKYAKLMVAQKQARKAYSSDKPPRSFRPKP